MNTWKAKRRRATRIAEQIKKQNSQRRHSERSEESLSNLAQHKEGFLAALGMTKYGETLVIES